ncbi:patatin-like phospholipase family protein [Vitiosangium sp. GDMCC 1.1324]|uniref:patatin-like phospholipase family protein n=1 Tax=Vitiosangium sp. (strain GDMCC 1.1324) TaxID=2138576 RepID=UPI000D360F0A|nr:patatin-like phospholipase family protein [Vitiosangium sp. GDMCC 1.1324]PTL83271.1 phospholipase [Vitiosangium sp. GDMCC 1.1324]
MSVKPTSANPLPVRRQPEASPSNPLEKVGQALQHAAKGIGQTVNRVVDTFEAKLPSLNQPAGTKPWEGITLTGKPLQIPLDALKKVDLGDLRNVLERIFPPKVHDDAGKKLVDQTKDFRETLGKVRQLSLELEMTPATSPRRAELQKALDAAEGKLKAESGYTRTTAPRPGALWVDPQFFAKELPGGKLNASQFPTGTPVTKPPAPMDFLFGKGPHELKLGEGPTARTVRTPEQYRAAVAARRAELGMPVKDGEPVGVHLSLQGGGGKGKRYGAMLAEMYDLGVVPTSLSGTSAGSIAAAFAATGAGPEQIQALAKDPRLSNLYDWDLDMKDGGLLNGQKAFELVDQELRRLTGITDRPVTFADLKVPLQILATKDYDTGAGPGGMTSAKDRIFVFSQETTPDTPVALAVRASMAIPGVFEPVQVVDPTTGRRVHLVDGGALDNLPMGYNKNDLPQIGASLTSRASGHPASHQDTTKPLPSGNLDSTNVLWNALNGYTLMKDSGSDYNDYLDRTQPKTNQFMLSLPTWDLTDPSKSDSTLKFGYDDKVDPALDSQSREVTRDFLRNFLDDLKVPGSKGTNYSANVPKNLSFDVPVDVKGKHYQVSYAGGDTLVATPADGGKRIELAVGRQRIEAMYLDNMAFGDLKSQLAYTLTNPKSVKPSWLPF